MLTAKWKPSTPPIPGDDFKLHEYQWNIQLWKLLSIQNPNGRIGRYLYINRSAFTERYSKWRFMLREYFVCSSAIRAVLDANSQRQLFRADPLSFKSTTHEPISQLTA